MVGQKEIMAEWRREEHDDEGTIRGYAESPVPLNHEEAAKRKRRESAVETLGALDKNDRPNEIS